MSSVAAAGLVPSHPLQEQAGSVYPRTITVPVGAAMPGVPCRLVQGWTWAFTGTTLTGLCWVSWIAVSKVGVRLLTVYFTQSLVAALNPASPRYCARNACAPASAVTAKP